MPGKKVHVGGKTSICKRHRIVCTMTSWRGPDISFIHCNQPPILKNTLTTPSETSKNPSHTASRISTIIPAATRLTLVRSPAALHPTRLTHPKLGVYSDADGSTVKRFSTTLASASAVNMEAFNASVVSLGTGQESGEKGCADCTGSRGAKPSIKASCRKHFLKVRDSTRASCPKKGVSSPERFKLVRQSSLRGALGE